MRKIVKTFTNEKWLRAGKKPQPPSPAGDGADVNRENAKNIFIDTVRNEIRRLSLEKSTWSGESSHVVWPSRRKLATPMVGKTKTAERESVVGGIWGGRLGPPLR